MKITFVRPNIGRLEHSLYVDEGRMEPVGLGVLAGLTPRGVDCALCDDRIEAVPFDEPTDLAAITVETYTARRAYEIAAEYRRRDVPVVMGGFHATLCPEEVRRYAESVVVGEAEELFPLLLDDYRHGRPGQADRSVVVGSPAPGTCGPPSKATLTRRE